MKEDVLQVTENISLIPPKESFAEELFAIIDSQRDYLREWLPWVDYTKKVKDSAAFLKESALFNQGGQKLTSFIFYKKKLIGSIGFVGISKENRSAEMGYWLRKENQGQGIITKSATKLIAFAFTKKAINRIEIKVVTENIKSIEVPKRLGFQHEGTLQEALYMYEKYRNLELYSLTKRNWRKLKK